MATTLPLIEVHGDPYERGVQHGRQAGDLIARYASVLLETIAGEASLRALDRESGATLSRESLLERAMAFLPQMEAFAPQLVEEIRGIADGARVPFAEALLCNVRAEVMGLQSEACTSFAVGRQASGDGSILLGQNSDQSPLNRDLQVVLRVKPDDGPACLMATFAGLVGYPGLNEAGVSFFQNALSTPVWRREGMPHYLLKRVLLEQTRLEDCLAVFRRARLCSSANYVLADRKAVVDVESTPDGFAVLPTEDDLVSHGNHFLHPTFQSQEALLPRLPDSARRQPRLRSLLLAKHGALTLDDVKAALADHDGYPVSICRHEAGLATIASIIAEPDHGRLHVAAGNPCEQEYVTYSL